MRAAALCFFALGVALLVALAMRGQRLRGAGRVDGNRSEEESAKSTSGDAVQVERKKNKSNSKTGTGPVVMGFPMGRLCNRIDELLWGMHVARARGQPLLLWGPWRTLLTEDLDLEVFTKYMGRENFKFLKPDDPLIPYEERDTWAMRACAAQHRMDEMRGILPAENHRRSAKARLVALRAAISQPGIVASVHQRWFEGFCVTMIHRMFFNQSKCHSSAHGIDHQVIQRWSEDICPYTEASLTRLFESREIIESTPTGVYLATDQEKSEADKRIVSKLGKQGITVHVGAADDIMEDIWASVESDFHFGNPSSSCDGLIAQWRALAQKSSRSMFPSVCYEGYFDPRPEEIPTELHVSRGKVARETLKERIIQCRVD